MKINAIRPYTYFLDAMKVNFKLPFENLELYYKNIVKDFYSDFHSELKYMIERTFHIDSYTKETQPEFIHTKFHNKDNHYNYKVEWGGKFFASHYTKNIKSDTKIWFHDYSIICNYIEDNWYNHLQVLTGKDLRSSPSFKIHVTMSRIDIARNHRGDMIDSIPLMNQNHTEVHMYMKAQRKNKPYIGGLSIGKRDAKSGIHFRAYDKRFDLKGLETSLQRFGTIYYVRKEWELKNRALRRFNIVTPEDWASIVPKKKILTEIIYRCRKSADCIIKDDNMLYKSIHNEICKNRINPTEGYTMDEHTFNKMIKTNYAIFTKRVNSDKIQIHKWNPLKQLNGLIEKRGQHLGMNDCRMLIDKLIGTMELLPIEKENYQDHIINTMDHIKNDPVLVESLKRLEMQKKAVFNYTQQLIKDHKKNKAAEI